MTQRPEQRLQIELVNTLRAVAPALEFMCFHVPNGGYRTPREAVIFKTLGVLPGIPDLVCLWSVGQVGFIELKAHNGALTNIQNRTHAFLRGMGFQVAVVRSVEQALETLKGWGAPINGRIAA